MVTQELFIEGAHQKNRGDIPLHIPNYTTRSLR